MENCKTMVFSEAIEGLFYCGCLICRYIGDMFIISCIISFFIAYSRKWMWVYIIVFIDNCYLLYRFLSILPIWESAFY